MLKFVVNSLAQANQCNSKEHAEAVIRDIIGCFEYMLPALQLNRAILLHDPRHDDRPLLAGESFHKTISDLDGKHGPDLRKKWFLFTKNHAKRLGNEIVDVGMVAVDEVIGGNIRGPLDKIVQDNGYLLISFGGTCLLESARLRITSTTASSEHANAYHLGSLRRLFPQYSPSAKHGKDPYFDHARKENVAAMPLSDEEAQKTLISGLEHAGDYWGYHQFRDAFFRFKATLNQSYHGFEVAKSEVPKAIVDRLKNGDS